MRRCAKVGCGEPAGARVVLRYGERVLWLRELAPERDPNFIEVCQAHADRMTPPVGWARLDERAPAPVARPAPPPEPAEVPRHPRGTPIGSAEDALVAPVAAAGGG
ncbi:MAG TPA: DUF3499 family protein [Actinomycetota bacterium]|nr:DUF3499 family protein [Actinomycetota bacterium]